MALLNSLGMILLAICSAAHPAPMKVDLSPEFARLGLAPLEQRPRDVCSLFAITALAEFEVGKAKRPERLSVEYLIWAANDATGLRGDQAMFVEAVHGLNVLGICKARLMPYETTKDPARKPSVEALADAKKLDGRWRAHWIKRWDLQCPLTDAQLDAIKQVLANDRPVACGLRWPKTLAGSEMIEVPPAADVFDGHSIAFTGYDNARRVFLFRNSWGPEWGDHGYGVMSYDYARAYANDALWIEMGAKGSEVPLERFEAESMQMINPQGLTTSQQDMAEFDGKMWSGGRQLFVAAKPDAAMDLEFTVARAGRYRVRVLATAAPDFAKVRVTLDDAADGVDADLYSGRVNPYGAVELGAHKLLAGRHLMHVRVVGKNSASSGYNVGIDCIELLKG